MPSGDVIPITDRTVPSQPGSSRRADPTIVTPAPAGGQDPSHRSRWAPSRSGGSVIAALPTDCGQTAGANAMAACSAIPVAIASSSIIMRLE
ncbi:MAG: hypothetical protein NVSMB4_01770 [Acidimicrobiales bacterium]